MAAVIYFIACWLLSRLAEWLPERMQQRTAAPAEPEPVAPIAAGDPSNINQIAVAKEVEELPLGGAPRQYHVHHRGTNASIRNWRRTRYEQGYDATQPESQIDPETGRLIRDEEAERKAKAAKAARLAAKAAKENGGEKAERHDQYGHGEKHDRAAFKPHGDIGKKDRNHDDMGHRPRI